MDPTKTPAAAEVAWPRKARLSTVKPAPQRKAKKPMRATKPHDSPASIGGQDWHAAQAAQSGPDDGAGDGGEDSKVQEVKSNEPGTKATANNNVAGPGT